LVSWARKINHHKVVSALDACIVIEIASLLISIKLLGKNEAHVKQYISVRMMYRAEVYKPLFRALCTKLLDTTKYEQAARDMIARIFEGQKACVEARGGFV